MNKSKYHKNKIKILNIIKNTLNKTKVRIQILL